MESLANPRHLPDSQPVPQRILSSSPRRGPGGASGLTLYKEGPGPHKAMVSTGARTLWGGHVILTSGHGLPRSLGDGAPVQGAGHPHRDTPTLITFTPEGRWLHPHRCSEPVRLGTQEVDEGNEARPRDHPVEMVYGGSGATPYQLLGAQVCQEASPAPSSEPLSLHPSPRTGVTGALILTSLLWRLGQCPEPLARGTQGVGGDVHTELGEVGGCEHRPRGGGGG